MVASWHGQPLLLLYNQVPKENATNYGCLVADPKTCEITHYVEKPETFVSDLISCGVYLFHAAVFKDMEASVNAHLDRADTDSSTEALLTPDRVRLEQDILRPLAGTGRLFVFETTEFWRQIKTAGCVLVFHVGLQWMDKLVYCVT